ncbi:MAG: hypothetical protein GX640_11595 [Fibrobacter sp.]|nr:hypothetical protein [Fibrobacter sp.]
MNKRFDPKKLTLTDFNPSDFQKATGSLSTGQQQQTNQPASSANDPVPEGRTTLILGKHHGVVSSQPSQPQPPSEPQPLTQSQSPEPVSVQPSVSTQHVSESVPFSTDSVISQVQEPVQVLDTQLPTSLNESDKEKPLSISSGESILTETQSPQIRNELSAALHVKANRSQYKKQKEADPEELIAFNTRQPKWLKDKFFMACEEKGATPSIVIRNLMKAYCGLCLVLVVFSNSYSLNTSDSTYSTEQILSYFYSKSFSVKSVLPDIRASIGARHSLWQTGSLDSTDYVYADRSNTRLEARIEIPVLDISYLRDRSKDKNELRAFVMKSLSKILAAQKAVNVLETRSGSLKSRLEYQRNQVALKLINKSDLFSIEDAFYNVQSQLYESQSVLEQRIIDLAVIAGNDWLECYKMIVRWDTKLFD